MRFRKNGILFWEVQILILICLSGSFVLMVYDIIFVSILLIPSVIQLGAFIMLWIFMGEYITISEDGISCYNRKRFLWEYKWSEIARLQISNRFRNPSVEVVLKPHLCRNNSQLELTHAYFQLGPTAKKALKLYCKCPINKSI